MVRSGFVQQLLVLACAWCNLRSEYGRISSLPALVVWSVSKIQHKHDVESLRCGNCSQRTEQLSVVLKVIVH